MSCGVILNDLQVPLASSAALQALKAVMAASPDQAVQAACIKCQLAAGQGVQKHSRPPSLFVNIVSNTLQRGQSAMPSRSKQRSRPPVQARLAQKPAHTCERPAHWHDCMPRRYVSGMTPLLSCARRASLARRVWLSWWCALASQVPARARARAALTRWCCPASPKAATGRPPSSV